MRLRSTCYSIALLAPAAPALLASLLSQALQHLWQACLGWQLDRLLLCRKCLHQPEQRLCKRAGSMDHQGYLGRTQSCLSRKHLRLGLPFSLSSGGGSSSRPGKTYGNLRPLGCKVPAAALSSAIVQSRASGLSKGRRIAVQQVRRLRPVLAVSAAIPAPVAPGPTDPQQGLARATGAGTRWLWLAAAMAAVIAVLPSPPGAVFLTYIFARWLAPAWAIHSLLRNPAQGQWLSRAAQVVLAVGLYAYVIVLGMPRSTALVSVGVGPGAANLSMAMPAGLARWITSSTAAPLAVQALALKTALGLAAAAMVKVFLHRQGSLVGTASDSLLQTLEGNAANARAASDKDDSPGDKHSSDVPKDASSKELVTECRERLQKLIRMLQSLRIIIACGLSDEPCIEPMWGDTLSLTDYLKYEQHRCRLFALQLRRVMQADGAKQEAALVDSLAVGLAAAVPRLSVARAALAAWMKGDRTTPVDLRLNPDSSAKEELLEGTQAGQAEVDDQAEDEPPARARPWWQTGTWKQGIHGPVNVHSEADPMPFNSSSPSDAAPSDARKVAYTDVPADQAGAALSSAQPGSQATAWASSSWGLPPKVPVTAGQVLGQMGRDPYAVPSFTPLIRRAPKPGGRAGADCSPFWASSSLVRTGDWARLEVLGRGLVDRLASKLGSALGRPPSRGPPAPAPPPAAADGALLAALGAISAGLQAVEGSIREAGASQAEALGVVATQLRDHTLAAEGGRTEVMGQVDSAVLDLSEHLRGLGGSVRELKRGMASIETASDDVVASLDSASEQLEHSLAALTAGLRDQGQGTREALRELLPALSSAHRAATRPEDAAPGGAAPHATARGSAAAALMQVLEGIARLEASDDAASDSDSWQSESGSDEGQEEGSEAEFGSDQAECDSGRSEGGDEDASSAQDAQDSSDADGADSEAAGSFRGLLARGKSLPMPLAALHPSPLTSTVFPSGGAVSAFWPEPAAPGASTSSYDADSEDSDAQAAPRADVAGPDWLPGEAQEEEEVAEEEAAEDAGQDAFGLSQPPGEQEEEEQEDSYSDWAHSIIREAEEELAEEPEEAAKQPNSTASAASWPTGMPADAWGPSKRSAALEQQWVKLAMEHGEGAEAWPESKAALAGLNEQRSGLPYTDTKVETIKPLTVGPGIGNAMAGDVREGEDVPVEQLVRDIYVHFEDGNGIGGKSSAGAGAGEGAPQAAAARMTAAFQDKQDDWDPDEGLYEEGMTKAAGARVTAAFQDKDEQWDPDEDLYSLSDDYENDQEAEALLNKQPVHKPRGWSDIRVEGDPTVM